MGEEEMLETTERADAAGLRSAVPAGLVIAALVGGLIAYVLCFATLAIAADSCPNAEVRAKQGAGHLPECRAYEMVSPVDKNDGEMGVGAEGYGASLASADGSALAYVSLGGWGDAPSAGLTGIYVGYRGAEIWHSTSAIMSMLPRPVTPYSPVVHAVSADFSKVVTLTNRDPDTGLETTNPFGHLFILDLATKQVERIDADVHAGSNAVPRYPGEYYGNDDFSRVIYVNEGQLTPDSVGIGTYKVFRYENGQVTLESKLPGEVPARGRFGIGKNPVSADANVFYFEGGAGSGDSLYRRDFSGPAPTTDLVSADENSLEDPGNTARFGGASETGQIVYFSSGERLVDEDTDSTTDIYRYDHSQPAGSRLTLISVDSEPADTPSRTDIVLDVANDGKSVFFLSESQLVAGETTEPGMKLLHYDANEGLKFVALTGQLVREDGVLSDNDRYFGFISSEGDITSEDSGGFKQAYLYNTENGQISCASCRPDGGPNTGAAAWRTVVSYLVFAGPSDTIRSVSDQGHVFFQTRERLLPADTNQYLDVYVWRNGELALISTGRSDDHSYIMDASSDGSSVFFATRERLVGWDIDDKRDAYVARIGPVHRSGPEPSEAPCGGDGCQDQSSAPPSPPAIGSVAFDGDGNVQPESDSARPSIAFKRLKRVFGTVASLKVRVPEAGRLVARGALLRPFARRAGRAGTYRVRIALKPRAKTILRNRKRLRAKVRVTFRTRDGQAASKAIKVTFAKPVAKRARAKGGR